MVFLVYAAFILSVILIGVLYMKFVFFSVLVISYIAIPQVREIYENKERWNLIIYKQIEDNKSKKKFTTAQITKTAIEAHTTKNRKSQYI